MGFGKEKDQSIEDVTEEKKSSRELAQDELRKWAKCLGLDTKRPLFDDILDRLTGDVEDERLTFNEETEVFTYQLLKALPNKTIITIEETNFKQKLGVQKFKENEDMDAAALMMAKHTSLTSGEVQQLKTRDQKRINAVIMGFLSQ